MDEGLRQTRLETLRADIRRIEDAHRQTGYTPPLGSVWIFEVSQQSIYPQGMDPVDAREMIASHRMDARERHVYEHLHPDTGWLWFKVNDGRLELWKANYCSN